MEQREKKEKKESVIYKIINNANVRTKMIIVCSIMFLFTILVGGVSLVSYNEIVDKTTNMEEETSILLNKTLILSADLADIRTNLFKTISFGQRNERQQKNESLKLLEEKIIHLETSMMEFITDAKGDFASNETAIETLTRQERITREYIALYDELLPALKVDNYDEAIRIININGNLINEMIEITEEVTGVITRIMLNEIHTINENAQNNYRILVIIMVVSFALAIILIYVLANIISKSMNEVLHNIKLLREGKLDEITTSNNLDEIGIMMREIASVTDTIGSLVDDVLKVNDEYVEGTLKPQIDVDKYEGEYSQLSIAMNNVVTTVDQKIAYLLDVLMKMSKGDFEIEKTPFPGEQAILTDTLFNCINAIERVGDEIVGATANANKGIIKKIDVEKYELAWRGLLEEINTLLETIEAPLDEVTNVFNELSQGNLSVKMIGEYEGVFNKMKINVNKSIDAVDKSIENTKTGLENIANSNLSFVVDTDSRGKFKEMDNAINNIVNKLNEVFNEFVLSSRDVSNIANQLTDTSVKIANGATEQASTMEELNATIEVISANTRENANKSIEAREIANKSRDNAIHGDKEMKTMLQSMSEIKEASDNIANIIKVIDDIAFQTNLLALNASVEAARAGQHGKGFAVVAEEVRTLAGRSKEAANETTALINESLEKVNLGNELAHSTASALNQIVDNVTEVSGLLDEISESSTGQAESISEIVTNLGTFEIVVQNNTNESEESAVNAKHLLDQAELLRGLIEEFELLK